MIRLRHCWIGLVGCLFSMVSLADNTGVNIVLTKGVDKALPIAVVPFAGQAATGVGADNIGGVIAADLNFSGQFSVLPFTSLPSHPSSAAEVTPSVWRQVSVDNVVVGSVMAEGNKMRVSVALVDTVKATAGAPLIKQTFVVDKSQLRPLAHHIADVIFQQLTGSRGIFSTRLAYVLTRPGNYQLQIADADGFNPRSILMSNEPIMSPAWSPDGKQLAYVSFEGRKAQIYITTIATGQRRLVSAAPGINGAPAWSPNGQQLALVLSKSGAPKIYLLTLAGGQLKQLTTGSSIDTEPNFAPDGQSLLFTSDRGGSPQIYRYSLSSAKVTRMTFAGDYNARASFSKDAKQIVLLHRQNGEYNIASQDIASGNLVILTHSGRDDSPTLAPNGMMVLFGNEFGELGLVSIDGRVKLRVPGKSGKVQDPAWSPFLN